MQEAEYFFLNENTGRFIGKLVNEDFQNPLPRIRWLHTQGQDRLFS